MRLLSLKIVAAFSLASTLSFADDFEDALAAVDSADAANTPGMYDVNHFEYFDCWVEQSSTVVPRERNRLKLIRDDANLCGCYTVREKGGFGWRANDEGKKIVKVWDLPKPRLLSCPKGYSCSMDFFIAQCMDHVKESAPVLKDFAKGGAMEGMVALSFEEDHSQTPFGKYVEDHKDRLDSVSCFYNLHERPDLSIVKDRRDPSLFHISGLPPKLIPSAIGRFTDFSDIRCLDKGVLTGFASNGYVENVRHVDENGLVHGEEIGYMNDPNYPKRQGPEWGKVAWTSVYKRGKRDGVAKFYRSNVSDRVDTNYYFKHLEVPYTQGFVNGTVRMFSDRGFLMAEIPYKRNAKHGRMTIFNPYKKKNVTLTFNADDLEGFVDFGDFGGVFHKGLPNGLVTFWTAKDTCYYWMPGRAVCYTERLVKKQWGTYKMGAFQGKMECADGQKGDVSLICPDLDSAAVKKIAKAAELARIAKEKAVAEEERKIEAEREQNAKMQKAAKDSVKQANAVAEPVPAEKPAEPAPVQQSAPQAAPDTSAEQAALEKAEQAKLDAQKARLEAEKALAEAQKAEQEALKAEREAKKAEKARKAKEKKAKQKSAKKSKKK